MFMDHVCAATVSFSKRFNYSVARGAIPDSLMNQIQGDKTEVDILDVTEFLDMVQLFIHSTLSKCARAPLKSSAILIFSHLKNAST